MAARRHDLIRQDDDELVPQAEVVHRDPRDTRARYRDDKVWGGSERISYLTRNVAGGGFAPVDSVTVAEMVRLTLRPPRLCGVVCVWTPVSTGTWNADGGTYTVEFHVAMAVGRSREELVFARAGLVAPFPQVIFTPFGTGAGATPSLILPVRTLYVSGRVFSTVNPTTIATFDSRFSAYAAPFFGDFGDPDGDEG